VRALISAGANKHLQCKNGWTCLHLASRAGEKEIVRSLLAAGVPTELKDKCGMTALDLANKEGFKKVVVCLQKAGAKQHLLRGQPVPTVHVNKGDDDMTGSTPSKLAEPVVPTAEQEHGLLQYNPLTGMPDNDGQLATGISDDNGSDEEIDLRIEPLFIQNPPPPVTIKATPTPVPAPAFERNLLHVPHSPKKYENHPSADETKTPRSTHPVTTSLDLPLASIDGEKMRPTLIPNYDGSEEDTTDDGHESADARSSLPAQTMEHPLVPIIVPPLVGSYQSYQDRSSGEVKSRDDNHVQGNFDYSDDDSYSSDALVPGP